MFSQYFLPCALIIGFGFLLAGCQQPGTPPGGLTQSFRAEVPITGSIIYGN